MAHSLHGLNPVEQDCTDCSGTGRIRRANKKPYLSWAYREWDEPCPRCGPSAQAEKGQRR